MNTTNQKVLIGGGILVIGIVIGVSFSYFSKPSNSMEKPEDIATTTSSVNTSNPQKGEVKTSSTPAQSTGSGNTFSKLFSQSGSTECTYEQVSTSTRSTNVIYIADGKMRGEFRTLGSGGNMMVYDGEYLYTWKEGTVVGVKAKLTSISQLPAIIPQDLTSGSVLGSGLNSLSWDCHPWIKNVKLLTPPSEVKF